MDTWIHGYRDTGIQAHRDTGYRDKGFQAYRDTPIKKFVMIDQEV